MDVIERWQSGDVSAFEALFHQYYRSVFTTALIMLGTRDEAEDALQEIFVAMWKSRSTFDPARGGLSTWLHRIAINHCASRRRTRRAATVPLEEATEAHFERQWPSHPDSPEELQEWVRAEVRRFLQRDPSGEELGQLVEAVADPAADPLWIRHCLASSREYRSY